MPITFMDLDEVSGWSTFGEVPQGSLVQFADTENLYIGVKTYDPHNKQVTSIVVIGGQHNGELFDSSVLPSGPYIDIGNLAKIVVLDAGFAPRRVYGSPITGCLYKSLTVDGVYYIWSTMIIGDATNSYWVCVVGNPPATERGDSAHALNTQNLFPISTRLDVRRCDWRS